MTKYSVINVLRVLRYIFHSIYFNFHYLPFSQAIRLPILLYKPHLHELKGEFILDCHQIKTGLIKLGFPRSFLYPNAGIVFENGGGKIVVRGKMDIGNASAISIGKSGVLDISQNMSATASFKLVCYYNIMIGENALFGWDCLIMDTDMHSLVKIDDNANPVGQTKGYASITIGPDVWVGNGCLILKGVIINNNTVIAARTTLTRGDCFPSYTVCAGNPPRVIKSNIYHDRNNDQIEYE